MSLSSGTQKENDYNHLKEITEQGIPLVLFDRITNEVECDKVIIDDVLGAYLATKRLIEQGRKRIGIITTYDYLSVSKSRTTGYQKALKEFGIKEENALMLRMPSMDIDEQLIQDFIKNAKVDAILTVNEIFSVYGMQVAQDLGHKIPEDISFIGFTDGLLSKYANPSLTSIAQHGEKMGETAAEMLIHKIESEDEEETYQTKIIAPTLIERNSTIN